MKSIHLSLTVSKPKTYPKGHKAKSGLNKNIFLQAIFGFKMVFASLISLVLFQPISYADTLSKQQAYLSQAFPQSIQSVQEHKVWILGDKKQAVQKILGHPYKQMRVGYWTTPNTTPGLVPFRVDFSRRVWFLQEIGKDKYIDVAITIEQGEIKQLRVLEFRESRGWEVKLPFFTEQFEQNTLAPEPTYKLTNKVDNISGATLSYRAVTKLARLALYLDSKIKPTTK